MHGERSDPENDSTLSFFDPKCGDTNTDVGRRSRSSAPEPTLFVFNRKPHYKDTAREGKTSPPRLQVLPFGGRLPRRGGRAGRRGRGYESGLGELKDGGT